MESEPDYWALRYFVRESKPNSKLNNFKISDSKEFYDEICCGAKNTVKLNNYVEPKILIRDRIINVTKKYIDQFFYDCDNGNVANVRKALEQASDPSLLVNATDDFQWTPLMCACASKSLGCIRELIKNGAYMNIDHTDKSGNNVETILHHINRLDLLELLIPEKNQIYLKQSKIENIGSIQEIAESFYCEFCKECFQNKKNHENSITHMKNSFDNSPIQKPACIPKFEIGQTNIGYRMLKTEGWDPTLGLGPSGSGRIFPLKVFQRPDRSGLGKKINKIPQSSSKNSFHFTKQDEVDFRRSFM